MGVQPDAPSSAIVTLPRLPGDVGWLGVADIPFGDGAVRVRHDGATSSTLTNESVDGELAWEARFPGAHADATVDGSPAQARSADSDGMTYTLVEVAVAEGETATVEVD